MNQQDSKASQRSETLINVFTCKDSGTRLIGGPEISSFINCTTAIPGKPFFQIKVRAAHPAWPGVPGLISALTGSTAANMEEILVAVATNLSQRWLSRCA